MTRPAGAASSALAVPAFFALKTIAGLAVIKFSARYLTVEGFTVFSQFFLLSVLLNLISAGGIQNGLIRQAAVAKDLAEVRKAHDAAFAIWAATSLFVCVPVALLHRPIAILLTGSPQDSAVVPWISFLCAAAGPSLIYGSVLAGRQRPAASLAAQGIGLLVGTAGALTLLHMGDAIGAVLAFTAGPVLTGGIGWVMVRRMALPAREPGGKLGEEIRLLLRYSGAFVITASTTSLAMFGLRYVYRQDFGVKALGFWLVGNRISDMNAQLTALFMLQIFLPAFAASADNASGRRIVVRSFAVATIAMAVLMAVFATAPGFFIHTFLSDKYLPAAVPIIAYMAGDVFRASAMLALQVALARRKLLYAIGLETGTVLLFAVIMLIGIKLFGPSAPYVAQVTAQAAVAISTWIIFWRTGRTSGSTMLRTS